MKAKTLSDNNKYQPKHEPYIIQCWHRAYSRIYIYIYVHNVYIIKRIRHEYSIKCPVDINVSNGKAVNFMGLTLISVDC